MVLVCDDVLVFDYRCVNFFMFGNMGIIMYKEKINEYIDVKNINKFNYDFLICIYVINYMY